MNDTCPARALDRRVDGRRRPSPRGTTPSLVDQILSTTGRPQPQPRWLVLLKEPPMRLNSRVAVGSPTRRLVLRRHRPARARRARQPCAALVMRPPRSPMTGRRFRGSSGHTVSRSAARSADPRPLDVRRRRRRDHQHRDRRRPGDRVERRRCPPCAGPCRRLRAMELRRRDLDDRTELRRRHGLRHRRHGAVDALQLETGGQPVVETEPDHQRHHRRAGDGRVYVATGDGLVVAFDARQRR